jgi:hypothetical protein
MIGRLAFRSLTAHPVRSAVLAGGFGAGVSVMAILLGVAEVVLDQATSSSLVGGGDVVIRLGAQVPVRMALAGTLQSDALRPRVRSAAPWHTADLYFVHDDGQTTRVDARGGIPSLERELDDPETKTVAAWQDSAEDESWRRASPEDALRHIDRFHPVPEGTEWSGSWAEWLYFNGRAPDARFYLTFMVGPRLPGGRRPGGVRLQLDRGRGIESFSGRSELTDDEVARAPDLTIGGSRVRLEGLRYVVELDLTGAGGRRASGRLSLDAVPGRLIPPIEISGARGWRTGYVVPVMAGALAGALDVSGARVSFDRGTGYHDHNWGFWEGVSWQWGQVQHGDLSFLYGRVFPPADAADPARIPGFIGALGPDGPLGFASNVRITEQDAPGPHIAGGAGLGDARSRPQTVTVRGRGPNLDVTLHFEVSSTETTPGLFGNEASFLQMRGQYTVSGRAGGQPISFVAPGSAETFRGRFH